MCAEQSVCINENVSHREGHKKLITRLGCRGLFIYNDEAAWCGCIWCKWIVLFLNIYFFLTGFRFTSQEAWEYTEAKKEGYNKEFHWWFWVIELEELTNSISLPYLCSNIKSDSFMLFEHCFNVKNYFIFFAIWVENIWHHNLDGHVHAIQIHRVVQFVKTRLNFLNQQPPCKK
jgi:hypothetical protein